MSESRHPCTFLSEALLAYITLLRLRMLAEAAPRWASDGQRCFNAFLVGLLLTAALYSLHRVVQSAVSLKLSSCLLSLCSPSM